MSGICLVVEDQPAVAKWLGEAAAAAFPDLRIDYTGSLAETRAWLAAWERSGVEPLETAIVDLGLPDGNGADLIRDLARDVPQAEIIVATIYDDDHHLFEALAAGARGYLLKDQGPQMMARILARMRSGEPPLSPAIARRLLAHFQQPAREDPDDQPPREEPDDGEGRLTKRETETLALLARGLTTAEVAKVLGLSQTTIATYVKVVYRKLNVSSRAEATLQAVRRGLL